jgi:Zn-dependent M28 family amino/carboxypeptidase
MVLLVAGLLTACGSEAEREPPPASQPRVERPAFNGLAAHALIRKQVAFGPRVPGTEGHARQLAWMDSLLTSTADSVDLQPFTYRTSQGHQLALTNVIARFRPGEEHRILLLTHWDTRPWADQAPDPKDRDTPLPGANDGGSGTAILLHLAQLMAQDPPPTGVDLLFTDGEDYGPEIQDMLLGAKYFASALPSPIPWSYGVLLDLVGDLDPSFPMEAYSVEYAPALTQRIWAVARDLGYGNFFPSRVGVRAMDDHVPLNQAGLPTVNIIDFEYGPGNRLWHTLQDIPENTSPETLQMVGEVVAELLYRGG